MSRLIAASAVLFMLCIAASSAAPVQARTIASVAPVASPVAGLPNPLSAARGQARQAYRQARRAAWRLGVRVPRPALISHSHSLARLRHARGVWIRRAHGYQRRLDRRARVLGAAVGQIGTRYAWGGSSPATGFDCSGLVMWAYSRVGIELPHSTSALMVTGRAVPRRSIRPGDLVFSEGGGHVGLYLAGGRVIAAPHAGAGVRVDAIGSWSVVAIRRVI